MLFKELSAISVALAASALDAFVALAYAAAISATTTSGKSEQFSHKMVRVKAVKTV